MNLNEVTGQNLRSKAILNESWDYLTESQRLYLGKAERELWPLMEQLVRVFEAELTADQIQAIFQNAEEVAMSGDNRSGLGKAASAAKLPGKVLKQINDKVNELGKMAQRSGPVRNADQQFEKLKRQIADENPKLADQLSSIGDWMKANPKKASLGIAILTAAAAFAGGPAGGAAAGFLLRSTKDLLKGEQLSTAVGKATKTAGIGALAGMTFDAIGDSVVDNIAAAGDEDLVDMIDSFDEANLESAMDGIPPEYASLIDELEDARTVRMSGNVNNFFYNYDVVLPPDLYEQFTEMENSIKEIRSQSGTFSEEAMAETARFHDFMAEVQNDPMQEQYRGALAALEAAQSQAENLSVEQLEELVVNMDNLEDKVDALSKADAAIASAVQAATQQADTAKEKAIKTSKPQQSELPLDNPNESVSMEDKFEQWLMEQEPQQSELPLDNPNTLGAKLKRGAKAAASKVGSAAKQAGKDLGNKVTANKLMKAWKSAGSPTDTGSIVNILSSAGLNTDQIGQIGSQNKVDLSTPADNDTAQEPAASKPEPKQPTTQKTKPAAATTGSKKVTTLADQIKKAGIADAVKQMLSSSA